MKPKFIPSLILILFGALFCAAAVKLGVGDVTAPGAGFVPFLAGALLILFSIGTIWEIRRETDGSGTSLFGGEKRKVMASVLISLFAYALGMDFLGFVPATFLLLLFLFKISGTRGWKRPLGTSALIMAVTYFLFGHFLKISFPKGLLDF